MILNAFIAQITDMAINLSDTVYLMTEYNLTFHKIL